MRITVRGFADQKLTFVEQVEVPDDADNVDFLRSLAVKHHKALGNYSHHMIEVEFMDEPDINQRFFRFGTDPSRMVEPVEIDLSDPS